MKGWIKLHRQIQGHWVFENESYFRAWIIILMEVNHSEKKVLIGSSLFDVNTGQSLNSLDAWASKFGKGWTKQKVRTFFTLLKNEKMINTQNERKTTRLTVCNYSTYQTEQHDNNTQNNTPATRQQHASNTPATPNKNDKNVENDKNEIKRKDIVEYLNKKTNKRFRHTSSNCSKHLDARIKEGYSLEDFKDVIDIKCDEWLDTDHSKYLRPETLFGTKFDSYLNQVGLPDKESEECTIDLTMNLGYQEDLRNGVVSSPEEWMALKAKERGEQ